MKPIFLDEGVIEWLEPETEEEREFLKKVPAWWSPEQALRAWVRGGMIVGDEESR